MQVCTKCLLKKPLSEFWKREDSKTWYRSYCKECHSRQKKLYYQKHKDNIKEKHSEYYLKNKERLNKKMKEYWSIYKIQNKEKIDKYSKEYREKYKELCRERVKKWSKSERWKYLRVIKEARRRWRKKSTSDWSITQEWLDNILKLQNYLCPMCWKNITNRKDRHLDHIYPLSKGGIDSITNVQWLCVKCNLSKWNKILNNN